MVIQKAKVRRTKPPRARRTRKDKSKIMCFPFMIFVFFVVKANPAFYVNFKFYHEVHEGREAREIKTTLCFFVFFVVR